MPKLQARYTGASLQPFMNRMSSLPEHDRRRLLDLLKMLQEIERYVLYKLAEAEQAGEEP